MVEVSQHERGARLRLDPVRPGGGVNRLEVRLDPAHPNRQEIADRQTARHLVLRDEPRRGHGAPRIQLLDAVDEPVLLGAGDLGPVRRVTHVRLDEREGEGVEPIGGQWRQRLALPGAPSLAGDLIAARGLRDHDHQVLGPQVAPEQAVHVTGRRLETPGHALLVARGDAGLERQSVTRAADIEGPLAEPAEPDGGRHQVLGGEPSSDARTEGVARFHPRRPRLPAWRQVEGDRQVADPLGGLRKEKQVPADDEAELLSEVAVAPAGEPHVAVPFARPGPHRVAHDDRRGERPPERDAGDVQCAVVDRSALDRRFRREGAAVGPGRRDVLDLEHVGRRKGAQIEAPRRSAPDPHRHRQTVGLPLRPEGGDGERHRGRTLAAGQNSERQDDDDGPRGASRSTRHRSLP